MSEATSGAAVRDAAIERTWVQRSNQLLLASLVGSPACCLAVAMLSSVLPAAAVNWTAGLLALSVPVLVLAALVLRFPRGAGQGSAEVDANGGLRVSAGSARWTFAREALDWASWNGGEGTLDVGLRAGDVVRVATEESGARALMRGLGLEERQRRAVFHLGRLFSRLLAALTLGPTLPMAGFFAGVSFGSRLGGGAFTELGAALGGLLAGAALFALLWRRGMGSTVVVGAEGLSVRELFRTRFVPWRRVRSLQLYGTSPHRGVSLTLDDGTEEQVWLGHDLGPSAETVVERIREAFELSRKGASEDASAQLARGGRTVDEWKAALQKLAASGGSDYRTVNLTEEQLWSVYEDGSASPELRAAAALVLRARKGEGAAERLRVAAEGAASEPVRVVLEQAAEGDVAEAALAHAARELEAK